MRKKAGKVHSFRKPNFSYSRIARTLSLRTSISSWAKPFSRAKARTASVRAEAAPQPHYARFRLMPNTPRWRIRPGLRFRLAVPMSSPPTLARYCT